MRTGGSVLLVLTVLASGAFGEQPARVEKKLIEFGWDEPDTAFMREHREQMERSPFDGCVFHINYRKPDGKSGTFTWQGWGREAFTEADVRGAIEDLKATSFRRFRHNFLRFNVTPGDVDWFDDFAAVLGNARLAALVAKEGGCPGLLFDIEQYNAPLFSYGKQRDAKTKSWEAYAEQARRRGREVMEAMQAGYPGLTVFLTFGYCLPWSETDGLRRPLRDGAYGLLAPFLDGMLSAAEGKTRFIDGCESAYSYFEAKKFRRAARLMREDVLAMVADRERYRRFFSISFGLWLDYDWRKAGWNADDPDKNVHTPAKFEAIARTALETADEYVWIYSETPRWWTPEGRPSKLPAAYDRALRAAKHTATTASSPAR
jgi:hypothetical protein